MLSASAINISTTLASPKTARETSSIACVMGDGTLRKPESSNRRNSGFVLNRRRALLDRANQLVQRAEYLHQPAAHLLALLEREAAGARIVAARQRLAHDVAQRHVALLDQVHDGAIEQRQRHAQI